MCAIISMFVQVSNCASI